jgi:hypothetical protein
MRHLERALAVLSVASLAFLAAGCNKGPAEAALEVAGQALEAAKPELAKYAPDELASLTAAVGDAKARLDEGRYTDALRAAQRLPARIEAAAAAAAARKEELTRSWTATAASLEPAIGGLAARMTELATAEKLPRGLDAARLAGARAELGAIKTAWAQAAAAFRAGDVAAAIRTAQDVKARAEALSGLLGLAAASPAAAPAAAPAAK